MRSFGVKKEELAYAAELKYNDIFWDILKNDLSQSSCLSCLLLKNDLSMKVIPWVIELDNQPIGVFSISPHQDDDNWEAGYFIDFEYQKMGYATEALYCGLKWCIDKHGADNIEAGITIHNTASRKLVEKLGFILEKTVEKDWEWNGVLYDSVYYYLKKGNLK